MSGDGVPASSGTPELRVVTPDASPEEIAALVVALAALQPSAPPPPRPRSRWADPARMMRRPVTPGPGGWRTSALP
ncbi:acyl-CoA carboxylase epsilon subunit [Nocardioides sp.]|uniref:acyl-CoA carboxylase epsilon subunit n=1 Tax=Nocardioides sp. TaxID=35761 RepID=UPI003528B1EA